MIMGMGNGDDGMSFVMFLLEGIDVPWRNG
jgi:hypothetical protein